MPTGKTRPVWCAVAFCIALLHAIAATAQPVGDVFFKTPVSLVGPLDTDGTANEDGPSDTLLVLSKSWMGKLDDATMLGEMSIPGTHGSAYRDCGRACTTQRWSLTQQLDAGIRFLDIRFERVEAGFELRHGGHVLDLSFGQAFKDVTAWLTANPTETVIMILQEQKADDDALSFDTIWDVHQLDRFEPFFLRKSALAGYDSIAGLELGDLRGKILLWRRFMDGALSTYGFTSGHDAYNVDWQKDYAISAAGGSDSVSPSEKRTLILSTLTRAKVRGLGQILAPTPAADWDIPLTVNFIGGSTTGGAGTAVIGTLGLLGINDALAFAPLRKAKVFNTYTIDKINSLCPFTERCTLGIVYADAPDDQLIYNILRTNF